MPNAQTTITSTLAERHEALWISLTALHKDIVALGAKKPASPVSDPVRISAEGLLSDCAPFIRQRRERLPVAAPDLAGLAVQLGQALSALDAWESQHTTWDARYNCRVWVVAGKLLPVKRLKPPAAALAPSRTNVADLRVQLARRIEGKRQTDFERGFRAGRAARQGKPLAEIEAEFQQTYPRLRLLD